MGIYGAAVAAAALRLGRAALGEMAQRGALLAHSLVAAAAVAAREPLRGVLEAAAALEELEELAAAAAQAERTRRQRWEAVGELAAAVAVAVLEFLLEGAAALEAMAAAAAVAAPPLVIPAAAGTAALAERVRRSAAAVVVLAALLLRAGRALAALEDLAAAAAAAKLEVLGDMAAAAVVETPRLGMEITAAGTGTHQDMAGAAQVLGGLSLSTAAARSRLAQASP